MVIGRQAVPSGSFNSTKAAGESRASASAGLRTSHPPGKGTRPHAVYTTPNRGHRRCLPAGVPRRSRMPLPSGRHGRQSRRRSRRRRRLGATAPDWHGYRDQQVIMPSGDVWFLYGALRGKAIVRPERGKLPGGWGDGAFRWTVIPASRIGRYVNPAAQVLGRAKLGRKETPSLLKAAAARRNGSMPCRGGRRRGRRPKGSFAAALPGDT